MKRPSPLWVWTPLFADSFSGVDHKPDPTARVVFYNPSNAEQMLRSFREVYKTEGSRPVTVFDVAYFPDDSNWCYVADAVNHSGANPLRGLGTITRRPFIDLSYLYHVPDGESGREVVALGDRYRDTDPAAFTPSAVRPLCSHLHDAAILAHAEGLTVIGVLAAKGYIQRLDYRLFI